jgi:hypothetical protein
MDSRVIILFIEATDPLMPIFAVSGPVVIEDDEFAGTVNLDLAFRFKDRDAAMKHLGSMRRAQLQNRHVFIIPLWGRLPIPTTATPELATL